MHNIELDWISAAQPALAEYASFIAKPGQWLLPSELALIAHVFHKTVHYYTAQSASLQILNPGQTSCVGVQFNGRSHYERLPSPGLLDEQKSPEKPAALPAPASTEAGRAPGAAPSHS